jgi:chromosome segregation ATPase
MNREFLKGLGLEDEAIEKIMAENGRDIEKFKSDVKAKETELASTKKQLVDANKEIESFKEMDVEAIKKAADEYKNKYEQAEKDAQAQIEALKLEHSIESALRGAKNIKAAKALLDMESLKTSKNIDKDMEAAITALKESDPYLFEETPPPGTGGSLGAGGKQRKSPITKEEFQKMRYTEKVDLFNKNPDLYNQLKD